VSKCRPMIVVSRNIRHMRIFVGVPLAVAPNDSGVVEIGKRFLIFLLPCKMTSVTRGGVTASQGRLHAWSYYKSIVVQLRRDSD